MKSIVLHIALLFICLNTQAQLIKPVKNWTYTLSKKEVKVGETVDLIFKADIDEVWYLYSSDFDPNLGPTVTTFNYEKNGGFKVIGNVKPIGAKEKYDSTWGGKVRIFKKHAEFRQTVKILKPNPVIKVSYYYQVCSDIEGKCIPFEEEYTFEKIKVIGVLENPVKSDAPIATKSSPEVASAENRSEKNYSDKITALETEKKKLSKIDSEGKDESVEYLRKFSLKYGSVAE